MNGTLLDKTVSKIIKTLSALAFVFCISCGDVEESIFTQEAFENQWWKVQTLPYCFTINTASQKLWYISYSNEDLSLHDPVEYEFTTPDAYSWEGNENFYEGGMRVVDDGDCWDLIYGSSRWEAACKCKSVPQEILDSTTSQINTNYKVDS